MNSSSIALWAFIGSAAIAPAAALPSYDDVTCFLFKICPQLCQKVTTVENFDVEAYASAKWYIHQQAAVGYLPTSRNFCTTAEYTVRDRPTLLGYTIDVLNSDQNANGDARAGNLCAYIPDPSIPSKLAVAPCFLPCFAAGPYWVVDYDEGEGYALISGGQPVYVGENGKCKGGTGVNNSGLWIFSRSQTRNQTLIDNVRQIALDAGFDLSVLNDVDQSSCSSGSGW
eukprot:CAMPEP_0172541606 /NCGR_PEP_ID=MMETSP1067-20121228/12386_1 /TAXON_ID=265564 ORGANISM="Thalassiosira punctigera, Strain Tpunct2005C2" /NCGR_SAMPLE_ID=MMETSP1067 /ASSEMBLY_ACC=CAM_ASM_000444 /LENGTH=226 /DNA_ID=CAMNT_0013327675 /DNA_START=142 /DNA_END=819 /DNA_ORIENTATION=+